MSPASHSRPPGFTLVEILVALTMFGLVAAAVLRLIVRSRRTYEEQLDRLAVQGDLRIGMAIVESELRGLDASDPDGGDILDIGPDRIAYNAMRVLAFLCRPAAFGATTIHVWRDLVRGHRLFDSRSDSLLVYVGSGEWARLDLATVGAGRECPGDSESLTLTIVGTAGVALRTGAPLWAFEGARLRLYRTDDYWLGSNRRYKDGGWTRTQPLVGPLAPEGFRLEYLGARGPAGSASEVVSVRVRLIVRGRFGTYRDSLATTISLRNNDRGG